MDKQTVNLTGVPETMLWPLHNRAGGARRDPGHFRDPEAIRIVDSIDYPFKDRFGRPEPSHVYRSIVFDSQVREHLTEYPECTIVELAAGLETQFARVDNGSVRWLAVDLPESIEVRERFLPTTQRHRNLALSALDFDWMDHVDTTEPPFITAGGLLMYFEPADARRLVVACAERFPGGGMVFDTIPHWFSRKTLRGYRRTATYTAPPMPWALDADEQDSLLAWSPHITSVRDLLPRPHDLFGYTINAFAHIPIWGAKRPSMLAVDFG